MKQQVHPLVAVLLIAVVLAGVWFVYTRVLSGQQQGTIGPPSGVSLPPPPGGADAMPEMPRTKSPDSAGTPEAPASGQQPSKPDTGK